MSKSDYLNRKQKELEELKKEAKKLDKWIEYNSDHIDDYFMKQFRLRNSIRHKINACKDRLSDKHKISLGYEEVQLPEINNY